MGDDDEVQEQQATRKSTGQCPLIQSGIDPTLKEAIGRLTVIGSDVCQFLGDIDSLKWEYFVKKTDFRSIVSFVGWINDRGFQRSRRGERYRYYTRCRREMRTTLCGNSGPANGRTAGTPFIPFKRVAIEGKK